MYIVESLYCTPETNIILYVNYTGIKKKSVKENIILSLSIDNIMLYVKKNPEPLPQYY